MTMSQRDIINILDNLSKEKPDTYFSIEEILEELTKKGVDIKRRALASGLFKLCSFGFVEYKGVGLWKHRKLFKSKQ